MLVVITVDCWKGDYQKYDILPSLTAISAAIRL